MGKMGKAEGGVAEEGGMADTGKGAYALEA